MTAFGLLHTVPALAGMFEESIIARVDGPVPRIVHMAEADVLRRALAQGQSAELTARVVELCTALAGLGVDRIMVTCSSIGAAADAADAVLAIPVLRVDRPMAQAAVARAAALGGRVGVAATFTSTLEPTTSLVHAEAAAAGVAVTVIDRLCAGAADARAAGRPAEHDAIIRAEVADLARDVDVVVLAQASMAQAIGAGTLGGVPVLTSVESGVAALVELPS